MLDRHGSIVEWSCGAEKLLGWSAGEAIGQPLSMIFTEEDQETGAPGAEISTAFALGDANDVRWHRRKDGSAVFCDGTLHKIVDEDSRAFLGFGKIMRQAYTTMQEPSGEQDGSTTDQRSFLAAVLESVDNGIVACDREGLLTFFNDTARRIHGLDMAPMRVEDWADQYNLYRADGISRMPLAEIPLYRALKGQLVNGAHLVVKKADGMRHHFKVTGRPLKDSQGAIMGAVISMHEITSLLDVESARADTALEYGKRISAQDSEDRMRKAQLQLQVATEAAHLGIWTWDVKNHIGSWENARMFDIFGVPADGRAMRNEELMADYVHPDDVSQFWHAINESIKHCKRFHFVGRYRRLGDESIRWVELSGTVQPENTNGKVIIIGTAADITLRKDLEQTVEIARLRLAATLEAGEVATWIWNLKTDRLIGDRNLAQLFGVPYETIVDAPMTLYTDAIHADDVEEVAQQLQHAVDTGEPYRATYRIAGRIGEERWVSARGRVETDDAGRALAVAGVLLDITSQKVAESELRSAEERYRTLITSMDEAFAIVRVLVDEKGVPFDYCFEEVNPAFVQQSGLVDAAGKTIRELVPDIESRWIEIYGRVALTRKPARFTEHSAAMGYWWDVYATPMGAAEELRIAILFTDITAKTAAQNHLRELAADLSETNRHKTEFLATLAHELRNPLAPMRTGLDLMRMGGTAMSNGSKVLDMMDRQMKQIVHLIDDLMDLSRINSGKIVLKKEQVDLKAVVANAVETALPTIEAARHTILVHVPDETIMLDADLTRLAQVFGNLLTNAVKYTPSGGRITVSVVREQNTVVIAVTDTGMGIPKDEQARVFDMFSQVSRNMGRAQGGLGIGLSLVRSLVEMHDGTIAVNSPGADKGTTFSVTLPAPMHTAVDTSGETLSAHAQPAPRTGLRVVVADDNVDAAHLLGDLLEISGHAIDTVHNGLDAVRKIVETTPDMAILDIGMPGLNGYEVARKIRRTPGLEHIVLVALTGWGGELDRSHSSDAGFDAHLTKPAGLSELNRVIDQAIRQNGARKE